MPKAAGSRTLSPLLFLFGNKSPFHERRLWLRAISPDLPEIQPAEWQCARAVNASPGAFQKSNKILKLSQRQSESMDINLPGHPCGAGSDRRFSWWDSRTRGDTTCGKPPRCCCRQAALFALFSSAAGARCRRNISSAWGSSLPSRRILRPHIPTRWSRWPGRAQIANSS